MLNAADVATLSDLLDHALTLAPAELDGWLAGLPPAQAHLAPRLQRMMAERTSRGAYLDAGPTLAAADPAIAHARDAVGPYMLLRELGCGGMGSVWLAERTDGGLKRKVALKLPRLAWGAGLAERMARERDIGALLEHPHIARLYEAGVDALGRPFLAFEFIDGVPLDQWCNDRQLTIAQRLQLFVQITRAVAYAHARLVVHRDLKPSNVLVDAEGQAHLLDFGIAKLLDDDRAGEPLTREHDRVLTLHYAAPEQIEGGAITVATDVYALGVLLYELLTTQRPHAPRRGSAGALEEAILHAEPTPASTRATNKAQAKALRGELDAIVGKALKRDPAARYATADALADDIEHHLHGRPVQAKPDTWVDRIVRTWRRHRLGLSAAAAIGVAVIAGFASTLALYFQVLDARSATEVQAAVARSVNDYLVRDLLAAANPMSAAFSATGASAPQPGQVPVRTLLDRAADRAGQRFAGQPELEAAVRMSLAEAYSGIAAYPESSRQSLIAHDRLSGLARRDLLMEARALLLAGRALRDADDYSAGDARLQQALAALAGLQRNSVDAARMRAEIRQTQAEMLYSKGNYGDAISMLQAEMPALQNAFGAVSHQVAEALTQLAQNQQMASELEAALHNARQALDIRLKVDGPNHPRAIETHIVLAQSLDHLGQFDETERVSRAAYQTGLKLLGPDHRITLLAQDLLAGALRQTHRLDEAIRLYEDAVARHTRTFGEVNFNSSVLINNLALTYADAGRATDAIVMQKRRLGTLQALLEPDHPDLLICEHNLADALVSAERWDEALPLQQQVLGRAPTVFGREHVFTGSARRLLGQILMHLGRWDEARAELLESRRVLMATLDATHPRVQRVDKLLAQFDRTAPARYRQIPAARAPAASPAAR